MSQYTIKKMETAAEMQGKGYVHWKSWQETYSGLIDDDYLKQMTLDACIEMAEKWSDNLIVAKDGEKVIGFVGYGPSQDPSLSDCGEIFALYVLEDYQNQKVGYNLIQAAFKELSAFRRITLWVLKGNDKAIRFYERVGFKADGTSAEIKLGTPAVELRMMLETQEENNGIH